MKKKILAEFEGWLHPDVAASGFRGIKDYVWTAENDEYFRRQGFRHVRILILEPVPQEAVR